jgi:hypothetical protein
MAGAIAYVVIRDYRKLSSQTERITMQSIKSLCRITVSASILIAFAGFAFSQTPVESSSRDSSGRDDVSVLKQQIAAQQKQIEDMRAVLVQMKQKIGRAHV